MKYITKFTDHAAYTAAESSLVEPNVSYCVNENEVHYNPYVVETRLIVTYNVEDGSEPTQLYNSNSSAIELFDKVEVDSTEVNISDLETAQGIYQLSVGEHTIKFTLKDPTSIADFLFDSCYLTTLIIPNSVTNIGEDAFSYCENLTSVIIGNSVTSIGDEAFYGCVALTSVIIPSSVTDIGEKAFYECESLSNLTIGNSVTSIGDEAFDSCAALTSVTIPNSVISIGNMAFRNCRLTNIELSQGVISIGNAAFGGNTMSSITIPSSVTSIGDMAFYHCESLISVTVETITPPTLGTTAFDYNSSGRKIYVPAESVNAYKAASGWSTYASVIEAIQ